jgi:hypothetical protein
MPEVGRITPSLAKYNPEATFDSPSEIVAHVMMTRGEKVATLGRWRASVLQRMHAASEGMHTRGMSAELADRLASIDDALRELSGRGRQPSLS